MTSFLKIPYWMFDKELNVKGNAVLIFAEIYSLAENQKEMATPFSYFEKRFGISQKGVIKAIDSLLKNNLIIKGELKNANFYKPNKETIAAILSGETLNKVQSLEEKEGGKPLNKVQTSSVQSTDKTLYKVQKNSVQSTEHTRIQEYNKNITRKREAKHAYGEFRNVLLTNNEKNKFISEYGEITFELCIKKLDEYIEIKRPKYKNHYLVLRGWVLKSLSEKPKFKKSNDEILNNLDLNNLENEKNDFIEGVVLSVKKIEVAA